jgi:protein TIF31
MAASTNDASKSEVEKTPSKDVTTDGPTEGTEEDGAGQMPDNIFQVTIKLPHEPFEMPITVCT